MSSGASVDTWSSPSFHAVQSVFGDDELSLLNLESIAWSDEATLVDKYAHPDIPPDRYYVAGDLWPVGMTYRYVMTQKLTSNFYIVYEMTTAAKFAVKRIPKRRVRFTFDRSPGTPNSDSSQDDDELISCFVGKREDGMLRRLPPSERYFNLSCDWGNTFRDPRDYHQVWIERERLPLEVSQTELAYESSASWYMVSKSASTWTFRWQLILFSVGSCIHSTQIPGSRKRTSRD